MISQLTESKKCSVEKAVSYFISEGLVYELSKMKKLPEAKTKEICETLGIKTEDNEIYTNGMNIMFDNEDTHTEFAHYLKIDKSNNDEKDPERDSCVFKLEIPQLNVKIWAYSLAKNPLINNLLGE